VWFRNIEFLRKKTGMTPSEHLQKHQPSFQIPYPKGILRLVMRLPILLYRLHLGWLLGKRFLLLEHRGRRSGILRKAVIEVVDYDPQEETYVAAAAWGRRSDWFLNILAEPDVHVTVGAHRFPATARQLSNEEAEQHLQTYSVRHPFAFKQIGSWLVGKRSGKPEEIIQAFVAAVPFVEFAPVRSKIQG
jgi:deazaflavin-dependent oxidoreductase (nitroreductase family)